MKSTDLMVGDYVNLIIPTASINVIAKIIQLYLYSENVVLEYNGMIDNGIIVGYNFNLIHPIPLTDEILEKNFHSKDEYDRYFLGYSEKNRSNLYLDGKWIISVNDNIVQCEFVHELQHVLKLFGIEKEIWL